MMLLRLITWPYVRKHLLRSVLTTTGIMLGVAVFVGMHTANRSVLRALYRTVDRIAGATQLQVTAGETGFDEEVLERVQGLAEVRVAVPVVEAVVNTGLPAQGNLLVLAVDMTGDRSLRQYDLESGEEAIIDDPLVFLAQPDSLIVTREFAERNGLAIGSRVPMRTMVGERLFTVRGIMKSGGLTSAFGGNLAVMDVYAAQFVFGRGRKFDRIDLALRDEVTLDQGRRAIQKLLGPGFQVEPPSSRGQQFESVLRVYAISMNLTSLFALVIGMFIIFNSFAIAVTQRRPEIGILRALGATRRQIRTLFLAESAIGGVFGSLVGLVLGALLARGIALYIGGLFEGVYGLAERPEEVRVEPGVLLFALAMGIVTSVIGGFIPSRSAARVDPVQALQKGKYQVLSAGENLVRRGAAAVAALLAAAAVLFGRGTVAFYGGYLLAIISGLLLTPTAALWVARALRPVLKWLRPVEGTLAADSLIQAPRRTSATVAALMLSLALVVGLGGLASASYDSIVGWVDSALNPDLFVTPSQNLTSRGFRFPSSMADGLRQIEGVGEVQPVRSARISFLGSPVLLVSLGIDGWMRRAWRPAVEGDTDTMYRETAAGRGVMISDNLAGLHGLHVGSVVELGTPAGLLRLPVAGILSDWSDQSGSIFLDRSVFIRYWNDDSVNVFRVYLEPGATVSRVREQIQSRFVGSYRLFVLTNAEVKRYITGLTDQWLGLAYSQIFVAVLVAILGIVNTLTVSIIDRRRELGVLQAVGALRRQLRHTVWMEALSIGIVGLILGLTLGALNLYYVREMSHRDITGILLAYKYPVRIALLLLPVILASAFISALWPAESAVRGSLVEALEYE
jgi:putative ABC transport system permease protein